MPLSPRRPRRSPGRAGRPPGSAAPSPGPGSGGTGAAPAAPARPQRLQPGPRAAPPAVMQLPRKLWARDGPGGHGSPPRPRPLSRRPRRAALSRDIGFGLCDAGALRGAAAPAGGARATFGALCLCRANELCSKTVVQKVNG